MPDLILVQYTGNADDNNNTGALSFSDDRPDLKLGEVGWVTQQDFIIAANHGVQLKQVTDEDVNNLGKQVPDKPDLSKSDAPAETAAAPATPPTPPSTTSSGAPAPGKPAGS